MQLSQRVAGCLLGTAVGDSLGLPAEGLKRKRVAKLLPPPLRQRMFFGRGFLSDDTLQSVFLAQSLSVANGDDERLVQELTRRLRQWFLAMPPGIGLNTAKVCLALLLGINPHNSGKYSAGNGAAMRSAVLGAVIVEDRERRRQLAEITTRITHTHPLAIMASQMVADLAANDFRREDYPEWPFDVPIPETGPTGYVVHTVNAVLAILEETQNFTKAMELAVYGGGDTDSVAAIVGGILGSRGEYIPTEWCAWIGWPQPPFNSLSERPSYLAMLAQHLLALPIILVHGFRRLAPPY